MGKALLLVDVIEDALDGVRLGFEVTVRREACATVDERHEALALSYLEQVAGVSVCGRP